VEVLESRLLLDAGCEFNSAREVGPMPTSDTALVTFSDAEAPTGAWRESAVVTERAVRGAATRYLDPVYAKVSVTRNVLYSQAADQLGRNQRLRLDIYQPKRDSATDRPVMIWAHGGSFIRGTKNNNDAVYYATQFARRGYVSISIDYRLIPSSLVDEFQSINFHDPDADRSILTSARQDAFSDAQAAVRWVRSRAAELRIDPDLIFFGGFSAGAVTATALGYQYDTRPASTNTSNAGVPSTVAAIVAIEGLSARPSDLLPGDPPLLIFKGGLSGAETDIGSALNLARVTEFTDAASAAGVPNQFVVLPNAGHLVFRDGYGPQIVRDAAAFLFGTVLSAAL
jgi:acetyl esterase/lipase